MSRRYKNIVKFVKGKGGPGRRQELAEQAIKKSDIVPETLLLEDYDRAFKKWVDENLEVRFEGEVLPTVALFANQRFGEYMQSWRHTDDKKNFLMNFKVITRENNPKPGKMYDGSYNVPNNKYYLMKRLDTVDENGRPAFIDVKMRQPYCVDIMYTVSIVTNKFRLINKFNEMMNDRFKSITSYIDVKGMLVSTILNDISDESDYQIDDRQYYSQSYKITVRGYMIGEDDYKIVEEPKMMATVYDSGVSRKRRSCAEIEETDPCIREENVYKSLKITVSVDRCANEYSFKLDEPMKMEGISFSNVKGFSVSKNGDEVFRYNEKEGKSDIDVLFMPGDTLLIDKILREKVLSGNTDFEFTGYNPYEIVDKVKKNISNE